MAKLLTHHDRFHVHALLGLTALLHFLFRFTYLFVKFEESFTPCLASYASLLVHVFLHVTSFQFNLPKHRLSTKPMIWAEFRMHNAIFTYRHIISIAIGMAAPDWWWRKPDMSSVLVKIGLLCLTCKCADWVTENFGSTEKRTTNAMPYPEETDSIQPVTKWFYAKSQFAATAFAAFGTPTLSFGAVLAIEIASFLMTLVRKGIIESHTYHIIYASALFINLPTMLATMYSGEAEASQAVFRVGVTVFLAVHLRMSRGVDKYLTWVLAVLGGHFITEGLSMVLDPFALRLVQWPGMLWSFVDTIMRFQKGLGSKHLASPAATGTR
eukprot:TRINITY_DN28124_c0_g1_i1.p1 TRINITY_DN28124_c0_g1~~TRINITY_DN28124_c0_g1_i1.p1  ORF type:complete len:325 (-),score=54.86 TRINITY_DN28124_c0_g1_i1:31-1005(-)